MQRNSMDYDRYLDEYRANLQLQINNNNKVYNAVSQMQQGVMIPEAPPDMRSLAEKIADIQNLKNQLSILLRQITDGANASMIVNKLNDDDVARAVQYFPALSSKLKSSYDLGVPSDVFIQALKNYSELQDENAGIDMGLQGLQNTSDKILLSLKNINDYGLKPDSVRKLMSFGKEKKVISPSQQLTLEDLEKIMLNLDDLERINQMPVEVKNKIEKKLSLIYPKLPTQQQFETAFTYLQTISDDSERKQAFNDMTKNTVLTTGEINTLKQYKRKQALKMPQARVSKKKATKETASASQYDDLPGLVPIEEDLPALAEDLPDVAEEKAPAPGEKAVALGDKRFDYLNDWTEVLSRLKDNERRQKVILDLQYNGLRNFTFNQKAISVDDLLNGINETNTSGKVSSRTTNKYWNNTNIKEFVESRQPQEGKGMRGSGLVQHQSAPKAERKTKAIRITGKIEKPMEYVPFGRYAINKFKLNDGILMLRTKSNNTIPTLAPQKVSKNIVDILKQIIIGGTPQFESISSLDASDKELLHKIVKLSHIDISVPTPDLTQREKDNHRFQVLRGQLVAGNNNQEVIRELKSLLLKFISSGTIPKQQANAVLYELMILSK